MSDGRAKVEGLQHIIDRVDGALSEASQENATLGILADHDVLALMVGGLRRDEKITQLFVVDLVGLVVHSG